MLVQLTDCHIGATWGAHDPEERLAQTVDAVLRLEADVDAVLVTGDLSDNGDPAEYAVVGGQVERLGVPVHVATGNHDVVEAQREAFDVPGTGRLHHAADVAGLHLVVLDSQRPGETAGRLEPEQLDWLDATLAARPDAPALLALHHPPLRTGVPMFDEVGLPPADVAALGAVVARHPQVERIVAGHVHRVITGSLAGVPVLAVPSVHTAIRFDAPDPEALPLDPREPPAFAVHGLVGERVVSHLVPVVG